MLPCLLKGVAVDITHTRVLFVTGDLKVVVKGCVFLEYETYNAGIGCIPVTQNRRNMFYAFWHGEFAVSGIVAKCNIGYIDTFINGAVCNNLYCEYAVVKCVFLHRNREAVDNSAG